MNLARISPARKATALLLAAVVFLLGLAAVSPDLHGKLHAGDTCHTNTSGAEHSHENESGEQTGHYCAVTLLQLGANWCVMPALEQQSLSTSKYLIENAQAAPKTLFHLPGNRGPPIIGLA